MLVSNRVALNRQMKQAVAEQLRDYLPEVEDAKRVDEMLGAELKNLNEWIFDFPMITVTSYHRLQKEAPDLKAYAFIVLDECHFFTSDAAFNIDTDLVMNHLVSNGRNAVRIYLSATIETVFEAIVRCEHRFWGNKSVPMDLVYYYMPPNYTYITEIFSYKNDDALLEKIAKSSEKWLIFVDSKDYGETLEKKLNGKCKAVFIHSGNKDTGESGKVFNELVKTEKFSPDVLISTAVLDNGINIEANFVHNIVLSVFDRVSFLQMLGRARRNGQTSVHLYLREFDTSRILRRFYSIKKDLAQCLIHDARPMKKPYVVKVPPIRYNCISGEYNENFIYQGCENGMRFRRLVLAAGATLDWNESPEARADASAIYKYYNDYSEDFDGRKKSYSTPWGRDVRKIFMPPDKIGDEKTENDDEIEIPSFLNVLYGYILPSIFPFDDEYETLCQKYRALADDNLYTSPQDEMLRWMGKTAYDCRQLDATVYTSTDNLDDKTYYKKFVVTREEFDANVDRKKNGKNVANENFLQKHGIRRNSDEAKMFLKKYSPTKDVLQGSTNSIEITDDEYYHIISCMSNNKEHHVYYLLVREDEFA